MFSKLPACLSFLIIVSVTGCAPVSSGRWYDSERDLKPGDKVFNAPTSRSSSSGSASASGSASKTAAATRDSRRQITVRPGDSYYSIARHYGVSARDLVVANGARPPYTLTKGQKLVLPQQRKIKVRQGDTLYSLSRRYGVDVNLLARQNKLRPPYQLAVDQTLIIPSGTTARQVTKAQTRQQPTFTAPPSGGGFAFPVQGRILSGYGGKTNGLHNDGINISVPVGTTVKASENGVVVYAGNDLPGYGNLMLIKHANGFVTAYAHNSEFLVRQGTRVKRGEAIAKSGQTGNVSSPQVHFEIRKGSQAINPQKLIRA